MDTNEDYQWTHDKDNQLGNDEDDHSSNDNDDQWTPRPRISARRRTVVVLIVIMLLALLALVLASLPPRLYVECQQVNEPDPDLEPPVSQIVITGPEGAVTTAWEAAGVDLITLRVCSVGYKGLGIPRVESLPFSSGELRHLSMGLYELESGQDLKAAVDGINDEGRKVNVHAHPNYLVGLLGQSSCGKPDEPAGSPWEVVGSPWEVVGSPWEVVGSPWEVVGSPWEVVGSQGGPILPAEDAADLFWNQWAFQQIGAGPFLTHTQESNVTTASTAADAVVRVGVFDTSPFPKETDSQPADSEPTDAEPTATPTPTATPDEIEWIESSRQPDWWTQGGEKMDMALTIYSTELPDLDAVDPDATDLRNHGLFVAGLIHAVAPESDIHLYRVLDKHGCGQVFVISEAILEFAEQVQADARSLDGAVINLSLGVHKPRTAIQEDEDEPEEEGDTDSESTADSPGDEGDIDGASLAPLAEDQIASLRTAVAFATEQRIVIVAAAGNDSYLSSQEGLVLSPHYPAQYPTVIGVSANNAMRQRSCFSNWGDIAAPGGDGGPGSILTENESALLDEYSELEKLDCVPLSSTCAGNCSQALISLIYDQEEGKYGYAYWQGTSFSTPLVSGAAALLLDAGSSCSCGGKAWLSPDRVFEALRCGAPTPDGVINIPASLYRCLP